MRVKRKAFDLPEYHSDLQDIKRLDLNEVYEQLFGNRPFDSLDSDERVILGEADYIIEKHKREWGIVYYEPYEALEIESTGLMNDPRHAFRRVKDKEGNSVPSGLFPQLEFHKSPKRIRMITSGNQAGKTQCGSAEAIWLSCGTHPYHKMQTPNRGRIIGQKLDTNMEVIWPKYSSMMPFHELRREPSKFPQGQVKKVTYKCGSTAEFMSYEMDITAFEGWTGDWIWFDEPPPKAIWTACIRGLMINNGIVFITATPLSEEWIYDEIYLKAGLAPELPSVFTFPMRGNPHLSDDAVKTLEDACEEDEAPARLDGVFKHLSGLVYKEFGMAHRIPAFPIPKDWTRFCIMDYHQRTPCAILWGAVDTEDRIYWYDELETNGDLLQIADAIMLKEKLEYGSPVTTRRIDSIAATPDRATGQKRSSLQELRRIGSKIGWSLAFRASVKKREYGIKTTQGYVRIVNGSPGMFFLEGNVPKAVASMMHHQWADENGEKTKTGKHKHFADCIRYGCVEKPKYKSYLAGEEGEDKEETQQDEIE